jgi:hypothetical protein
MTDFLREARKSYLSGLPRQVPPGAGAFDSGHTETGEWAEELLGESGFAEKTERCADANLARAARARTTLSGAP